MSRCTSEAVAASGQALGARAGRRRITVLVVDDDEDVRETVVFALSLEGYATVEAVDGLDALLSLRTGPRCDAIVLDLEMPVMAGWEFRAAQLQDPALAHIPVIVVSSSTHSVNADRRLSKPFDVDDLLAALREVAGAP